MLGYLDQECPHCGERKLVGFTNRGGHAEIKCNACGHRIDPNEGKTRMRGADATMTITRADGTVRDTGE